MNKLYFCVGLPGAGKSTWANNNKENLNVVVHSSDSIREELGDINDQTKNEQVFNILHKRIKDDLLNGKNVIYDSTGLKRKDRLHFLKYIKDISCEKICILFATPYETCIKNNKNRERQLSDDVIKRKYKNFEVPCKQEGWDDIKIVWFDFNREELKYNIASDVLMWKSLSHNNPHHKLSIGNHMAEAAYKYHSSYYEYDPRVYFAILMHDCGKPFTKEFVDSKNNPSETAHFYEHHNVGAYNSLFYVKYIMPMSWTDEDVLYISLLVNLHMRPFLAWKNSNKAKDKDRRLFGEDIIKQVEIIHECDVAAH